MYSKIYRDLFNGHEKKQKDMKLKIDCRKCKKKTPGKIAGLSVHPFNLGGNIKGECMICGEQGATFMESDDKSD